MVLVWYLRMLEFRSITWQQLQSINDLLGNQDNPQTNIGLWVSQTCLGLNDIKWEQGLNLIF